MIPDLKRIQRILLEDWDPIGIAESPEASDEYDSIALHIFVKLKSGWSQVEIANYLNWAARDHMGLGDAYHDAAIAADAQKIARMIVEGQESSQ